MRMQVWKAPSPSEKVKRAQVILDTYDAFGEKFTDMVEAGM